MPDLLERLAAVLGDRYAIEREVGRGGMEHLYFTLSQYESDILVMDLDW